MNWAFALIDVLKQNSVLEDCLSHHSVTMPMLPFFNVGVCSVQIAPISPFSPFFSPSFSSVIMEEMVGFNLAVQAVAQGDLWVFNVIQV